MPATPAATRPSWRRFVRAVIHRGTCTWAFAAHVVSHRSSSPPSPAPHPTLQKIRNNHLLCAELLLQNGADIQARGCGGRTALHYATDIAQLELVCMLLKRGADTEVPDDVGQVGGQERWTGLTCARSSPLHPPSCPTPPPNSTLLQDAAGCGPQQAVR